MVFSSSASIYGPTDDFSVDETSALSPESPYARTKAAFEGILSDVSAGTDLRVLSLRYFNPIGSDPQLRTGLQVRQPSHALGKMLHAHRTASTFQVTGTDWPTRDGTGIRDYVHVWDLAKAHVSALERFDDVLARLGSEYAVINLGTGRGTTVRELLQAVGTVLGEDLPFEDVDPRPGDIAGSYTRSGRAGQLLQWQPRLTVEDGIRDTLRWLDARAIRMGF